MSAQDKGTNKQDILEYGKPLYPFILIAALRHIHTSFAKKSRSWEK